MYRRLSGKNGQESRVESTVCPTHSCSEPPAGGKEGTHLARPGADDRDAVIAADVLENAGEIRAECCEIWSTSSDHDRSVASKEVR
jgi:hypothetical protein